MRADTSATESDIAPGLALKWTPNSDGTVWTFKLRQNVKWHDGSPFTSDDVVATMERLVTAGNSGLKGVLPAGRRGRDRSRTRSRSRSSGGERQLPVSRLGVQRPDADHPERLRRRDDVRQACRPAPAPGSCQATTRRRGATFERNPDWWGGKTPLDGTEFIFFDATGPMVTAYQGGQVDAIVQFDVLTGESLLQRPELHAHRDQPAALHRQIWMRCDNGQFTDKRVRQALAYTFDRPALIQQLFKGKAQLGNDHVIWQGYPYFDSSVPQRTQDIAKAKSLLAAAGVPEPHRHPPCGPAPARSRTSRALLKSQAAPAGITLNVAVESLDTFYGAQWCPEAPADPPCSGAAELGIVDYGHRATPDVYLNAALKIEGHLEFVAVHVVGVRRGVHGVPGGGRRRRAEGRLHEDRDDPQRGRPGRPAVLLQLPRGQLEEVHRRLLERPRADVPSSTTSKV